MDKDASIRFRLSSSDKERIAHAAAEMGVSMSDFVRRSSLELASGLVPGQAQRHLHFDVRRTSNSLIDVLAERPVDVGKLRSAAQAARIAARACLAVS